ncbi:hypothetical protein QUB60_08875 [Microcoleus sp. A2-C5]|uniref:hypothetical protein n=1 Tax=Microcoleaceae TaxID=1892252 RepID=UPI002237FEAA|nr:hypothetical protein [Lyngbya sp. CCAP 1446/10]MCW6050335.1 hypothetical protein [Lyngbya sp. CCAP 1446/10]
MGKNAARRTRTDLTKKEEGRRKKEEGRGKKEEGRRKKEENKTCCFLVSSFSSLTNYQLQITNSKILNSPNLKSKI